MVVIRKVGAENFFFDIAQSFETVEGECEAQTLHATLKQSIGIAVTSAFL